jgi:hypothetical protein
MSDMDVQNRKKVLKNVSIVENSCPKENLPNKAYFVIKFVMAIGVAKIVEEKMLRIISTANAGRIYYSELQENIKIGVRKSLEEMVTNVFYVETLKVEI